MDAVGIPPPTTSCPVSRDEGCRVFFGGTPCVAQRGVSGFRNAFNSAISASFLKGSAIVSLESGELHLAVVSLRQFRRKS